MHTSVKGEHVVLAERIEVDVTHDDHLTILLAELGGVEYRHRVLPVAACQVLHGTCHTQRRPEQSLAPGVLPHQFQYAVHVGRKFLLHRIRLASGRSGCTCRTRQFLSVKVHHLFVHHRLTYGSI